jgi:1-aminocyclopropane-1-carboxylate deaminase/D-cysteine desulfhydrase-like pyridoxal-dependent ACC family enzyme
MALATGLAIAGMAMTTGMSAYTAVKANQEEKDARIRKEAEEARLEDQRNSRQQIYNPMAGLTNEAEKIGVATKAAEFQAEQADLALANTLDTIMATGSGGAGATALAQAALQSKQGIQADIQRQELTNAQNVAATQMKINEQKAQGAKWAWEEQEQRDMIELDRTQNLIDKFEAQEFAYQAQKMEAIGNVASSLTSGMFNIAEGMGTDQMVRSYTEQQMELAKTDPTNPYAGFSGNTSGAKAYGMMQLYNPG